MCMQHPPRIASVIPAFNEAPTIAEAVREILAAGVCDQVIVVDDGSTDGTAACAREAGATVLCQENRGKGAALAAGVAATTAPVILFSDADVLGLTPEYVRALVRAVDEQRAGMVVGIRARHRVVDAFTQRVLPKLSGMRGLRREIFEALDPRDLRNFRIETALNYAARRLQRRFGPTYTVMLHDLRHVTKEQKRGRVAGLLARTRMIAEVVHAHLVQLRPSSG